MANDQSAAVHTVAECVLCGGPVYGEGSYGEGSSLCSAKCSHAWFVLGGVGYRYTSAEPWPIAIGLAIRRFVRRAEVAELRNTVVGKAHNWRAMWRPEDDGDRGRHWNDMLHALDRLAALAMESER